MGASDLTPPTASAVTRCASTLGDDRRFYTTSDTVADLDALRVALGVDKLALDGVSYGTYVAERYALAHPANTSRLILDSVVPHDGVSVYSDVPMRATTRVLGTRLAGQLATVIRREHNGPQMLDFLTAMSIGEPHLDAAGRVITQAARGDDAPLRRLAADVERFEVGHYPASVLSQGLHASTLCADTPAPWGDARAPLAGRRAKLDAGAAKLATGPYDRATATGNGIALQCLYWPPEDVAAPRVPADLPNVPTLILAGDHDLSTPLEWARQEAAHAPGAQLVVVRGDGHSVQGQGGKGLAAAKAFLDL
jgi:pimeloyl-ACP methyl ester carboxylesterase